MAKHVKTFSSFIRMNENEMGETTPPVKAMTKEEIMETYFGPDFVTEIEGAILDGAELSGPFVNAKFSGSDFTNVKMEGCDFSGADFSYCKGLDATQPGTDNIPSFYLSRYGKGTNFTGCDLSFIDESIWPNWREMLAECIGVEEAMQTHIEGRNAANRFIGGSEW
jgi:hypothetical protein